MSTVGYGDLTARRDLNGRTRRWRRFARALRRFDRNERYSPVLSVATILAVGVIVKLIPVMHFYVAQN